MSPPASTRPSHASAASLRSPCSVLSSRSFFAAGTDDPSLVPLALGEDSPEFVGGSTDAFRAAMIVAAALAVGGSAAALGYSRRPEAALAREEAEAAAPRVRLDPAAPDCPSVCLVHSEHKELTDLQAGRAATDG